MCIRDRLVDAGVKYVILGHSERRQYFAETDETVNKKVKKALEHGLTPIMCCGETLEQREQGVTIDFVRKMCIRDRADVTLDDIDAIGVTYGPGLVGALLVGLAEAKALAFATDKPLVGVHHIEGHISANYIEDVNFEPPYIALVVSGGHTNLVYVADYGKYEIMGSTRDDAAGEAFDKVARVIGMGYPGGPKIQKAAEKGNKDAVAFPHVFLSLIHIYLCNFN